MGYLIWIIQVIVSTLPFVMIDLNFWLSFVFISIQTVFPPSSIIFWIWGLICAINGKQDIWAIIYYVTFAVLWLPFYVYIITSFISKIKSKI